MPDTFAPIDVEPISDALLKALIAQLRKQPGLQFCEEQVPSDIYNLEESLEAAASAALRFFRSSDGGELELINRFEDRYEAQGIVIQRLELEGLADD